MLCFPAIDIRGGKVVRLLRGLYNKETVYSEDPVSIARQWKEQGAAILHIVDLDGAYYGTPKNLEVIRRIVKEVRVGVHLGGGLRSEADITKVLEIGVQRVIMSTKVFEDEAFLRSLQSSIINKVIVSIDTKSGYVLDKGWTKPAKVSLAQALERTAAAGVSTIVATDVACDGTLSGPNIGFLRQVLQETKLNVIASGGIGSLEDIDAVAALQKEFSHLYGLIVGKALYEKKIVLREAIRHAV